jgi:hypothetical protein
MASMRQAEHEVPRAEGAPYTDQVVRRAEYERTHPWVEIQHISGPMWRAVITLPEGERAIVELGLKWLLNKLDRLDEEPEA